MYQYKSVPLSSKNRHSREKLTKLLLVSGCFKPSQPQMVTSGLRETFIKRYKVEKINKAELKPEEQGEKAKSCRENLCNETEFKGP